MKTLALALVLLAAPPLASAQEVTIKLGTLAPSGSTWHKLLQELGEKWAAVSNGKVKLRIYAGGTQGSEGDMLRKVAVGQLHAASITNVGMHDIIKEPQTLSVPGMIQSEAEYDAIFPKVEGELNERLASKGFVALQWSKVGSMRIFCSKPYATPVAMSQAKMFAWDGDPASVEAWKAGGFRPVVLSSTDMVPALQTGMIECMANVPLYLLTSRMFERAKHMLDVPWGYLMGATIIKKNTWEKIPPDLRPKLIALAKEIGARVDADALKLNEDAIAQMRKQGLEIVQAPPGPWLSNAEKAWPAIRGKVVPVAFFDKVVKARDEFRAAGAGTAKKN